jgi:hypothetical protein
MRTQLMSRARLQKHPPVVPRRYAGLWIAWDRLQTKVIASGRTFADAKRAALAAGEPDPLLAKAPRPDARFLGSRI